MYIMINSVNVLNQAVNPSANVVFSSDRVRTKACACGGSIQHDTGSGLFTLTKPGIYEVSFNANISSATISLLGLQVNINGEPVGGSKALYNSAIVNSPMNVSAITLIHVPCCGSKTVSINNVSTSITNVTDANIVIKRLA